MVCGGYRLYRKICDDSTCSFFASLIYLALSLATNTESSSDLASPARGGSTVLSAAIDPHLSARMTSIIEVNEADTVVAATIFYI